MTKKVNEALNVLRFIRPCTTQSLRKTLVIESLVLPHPEYCTLVYHNAFSILRNCLHRLANEGVRYIFAVRRDEHITPYRRQLAWLCSDSRRHYFALLILYRIVRMREPPSYFLSSRPPSQRDLRVVLAKT